MIDIKTITQENAHEYYGKKLYADSLPLKHFHNYPLLVTKFKNSDDDRFIIKDTFDVCMVIPTQSDKFNRIEFERVEENGYINKN